MGDNSSQSLLLEWVNQQWKSSGNELHFYNFQQVKNSSFIYNLLEKVHPCFFYELNDLLYDFQSYFNSIEKYLLQIQGKKIRKSFKNDIIQQQSITDILKLLMYLLINSKDKSEYINRIFDMSVEIQTFLMQQLKKTHQSIQNYIEIKDILTTVENLQQENEQLRSKLKTYDQHFNSLHQNMQEIKLQSLKMEQQIKKYENQKKVIMEELNIVDLKEYIEIYKSVRLENEELYDCIHEVEDKKKELQSQNIGLKQRIYQDCHTINQLSNEIHKYKQSYKLAQNQISELSFSIKDSFQDLSILRQNKNIYNTNKSKRSIETQCSVKTSRILLELQSPIQPQKDHLKTYASEIIHKLQIAYKMIGEMGNEISTLKQQKKKVQKKNRGLQKKIVLLMQEQHRFTQQLNRIGI